MPCCCGLCTCCDCDCCEPRDNFNITDQIRKGELGCGWLYKKGKSASMWRKRFFVLTPEKLCYYTDFDRQQLKGEIILVGATIKVSATRSSVKKAQYFTITHPHCGVRELYAKSKVRRTQWIDKLTEVSEALKEQGAMMGKLYKQGGISKNVWQERWSLVLGNCIYYYEAPTDNAPKGFLELANAKIREFSLKDRQWCFEVVANSAAKKGMKKYNFCVDKDHERAKWLVALNNAAKFVPHAIGGPDETVNPLNYEEMERGVISLAPRISEMPPSKEGNLKKKSPKLMGGWQQRYFVLRGPGEMTYYDNETDYNAGKIANGTINICDIAPTNGVDLVNEDQMKITAGGRVYELKATSRADAASWIDAINSWISFVTDGN